MAYTLKQIRDKVIIDAGIEGSPDFPTLRLNEMINQAQRFTQIELNGLGAKKWESSASLTLADATYAGVAVSTSALPTGLAESPMSILHIVTLSAASNGVSGTAYEIDPRSFQRLQNNTYTAATASEPVFMRLNNTIYLAPKMPSSGTPTATAYYYKVVTALSTDADVTEIPDEFIEYVVKKVVSEINVINKKITDTTLAVQEIKSGIANAYDKYIGKIQSTEIVRNNDKLQ